MISAAYDSDYSMLRVCVADEGKGIDREELDLIFKKFGKLKRTAEMNHNGIGLGLLISKGLVEANGGELRVASEGKDSGAQFMFAMEMEMCQ